MTTTYRSNRIRPSVKAYHSTSYSQWHQSCNKTDCFRYPNSCWHYHCLNDYDNDNVTLRLSLLGQSSTQDQLPCPECVTNVAQTRTRWTKILNRETPVTCHLSLIHKTIWSNVELNRAKLRGTTFLTETLSVRERNSRIHLITEPLQQYDIHLLVYLWDRLKTSILVCPMPV